MKSKYIYSLFLGAALSFSSCTQDLEVAPLDENTMTAEKVYSTPEAFEQGVAKLYSIWAMSGQDGAGSSDVSGLDAGNCQFMRSWWNLNEVCTDEAKNAWGDTWVDPINSITWNTVQNEAIEGAYQRAMFVVALANEYIRQINATSVLSSEQKALFKAEARFNRALSYAVLLDLFRNPPFIHDGNFSIAPEAVGDVETRHNKPLFDWLIAELNECKTDLPNAMQGVYGRADKGAVNFLLARLYLNAEVYTGEAKYSECVAACNDVIAGGYSLVSDYANLFKADNDKTSKSEIIFPIVYEGASTQSWGGMTFLIMASVSGEDAEMKAELGVNSGWDGNRPTGQFIDKFEFSGATPKASEILDKRGMFVDEGRSQHITSTPNATFKTEGWMCAKFKNVTSTGAVYNESWPDTDFPLFRLADVYLMYAEAVLRGGAGGDTKTALDYVNKLRRRGYGNATGDIAAKDFNLNIILDERARELYWEGTRRTDLIRFGLFCKGYNWDFKGGVATGSNVDERFILYPIPATDLTVNGNLKQNKGYDTSAE